MGRAIRGRLCREHRSRDRPSLGRRAHGGACPDLLRKQATVIGSWTFSTIIQSECARFVADRGIDVDAIFTHRWRPEQAAEAYRLFDSQATGKGVLIF